MKANLPVERRCLVADDSEPIGRLLSEVLKREGYEVEHSSEGTGALRKAIQEYYSLLILDVHMPGKTGVEVVRALRALGNPVPVILMTSGLTEDVWWTCRGLSDLTFLEKPFGLLDLHAAVQIATFKSFSRSRGYQGEAD